MKKKIFSLFLLLLTTVSFSQNRYETQSYATYTPRSYSDIYVDTQASKNHLNRAIPELIRQCNIILDDTNFCTGDLRKKILSIKGRLDYINYQAKNGFISIYDAKNIYEKCNRDLTKTMRKHNKALDKQLQKKYKSKE